MAASASDLSPRLLLRVFECLPLSDLPAAVATCRDWQEAAERMPSRDLAFRLMDELEDARAQLECMCDSSLRSHVASLALMHADLVSQLPLIADRMSHLQELKIILPASDDSEGVEADSPVSVWTFSDELLSLAVEVPNTFSVREVNAVLTTAAAHLLQLQLLRLLFCTRDTLPPAVDFSPLQRLVELEQLHITCSAGADSLAREHVQQLRRVTQLQRLKLPALSEEMQQLLFAPPPQAPAHDVQWQCVDLDQQLAPLGDMSTALLAAWPTLTALDLRPTVVTHIDFVLSLPRLSSLALNCVGRCDTERVVAALWRCAGLTELSLFNSHRVYISPTSRGNIPTTGLLLTDAQMFWALSGLPNLKALHVGRLPSLCTLGWLAQESLAGSLQRLHLGEASREHGSVPTDELRHVRGLRALTHLRIQGGLVRAPLPRALPAEWKPPNLREYFAAARAR